MVERLPGGSPWRDSVPFAERACKKDPRVAVRLVHSGHASADERCSVSVATAECSARNQEQEQGAQHTADDPSGIQIGHALVRHQTEQEAADEGAHDPERNGANDTHALPAGHDGSSEKANDQTKNDECDDAHGDVHTFLPRSRSEHRALTSNADAVPYTGPRHWTPP